MTAYTFYIDSMGIILWQMETYFVNEKHKFSQFTLQVVGCVSRLENIFDLFNILKRGDSFTLTQDFTMDV